MFFLSLQPLALTIFRQHPEISTKGTGEAQRYHMMDYVLATNRTKFCVMFKPSQNGSVTNKLYYKGCTKKWFHNLLSY